MNFNVHFSNRSPYIPKEIEKITEVLNKADPLTQGKYLREFEEKFCSYLNVQHAFAVNNATSALELTAQLCQFKSKDEVIIPYILILQALTLFKKRCFYKVVRH